MHTHNYISLMDKQHSIRCIEYSDIPDKMHSYDKPKLVNEQPLLQLIPQHDFRLQQL